MPSWEFAFVYYHVLSYGWRAFEFLNLFVLQKNIQLYRNSTTWISTWLSRMYVDSFLNFFKFESLQLSTINFQKKRAEKKKNQTRKRVKRTGLQPGHWWGLDKEAGVPPKRVENPSSVHILHIFHILLHHLLTLCGLHYHPIVLLVHAQWPVQQSGRSSTDPHYCQYFLWSSGISSLNIYMMKNLPNIWADLLKHAQRFILELTLSSTAKPYACAIQKAALILLSR